MNYIRQLRTFGLAAALCVVLGGCGSTSAWDPTDLLNFIDMKKRAPGDRKPVFPDGVPGVAQGVPKEMVRGTPEAQAAAQANAAAAAAPPVEQPPAPASSKRAPKQKQAAKRAPAQAPVEVAPDDVNVEDQPPPRR